MLQTECRRLGEVGGKTSRHLGVVVEGLGEEKAVMINNKLQEAATVDPLDPTVLTGRPALSGSTPHLPSGMLKNPLTQRLRATLPGWETSSSGKGTMSGPAGRFWDAWERAPGI